MALEANLCYVSSFLDNLWSFNNVTFYNKHHPELGWKSRYSIGLPCFLSSSCFWYCWLLKISSWKIDSEVSWRYFCNLLLAHTHEQGSLVRIYLSQFLGQFPDSNLSLFLGQFLNSNHDLMGVDLHRPIFKMWDLTVSWYNASLIFYL